MKDSKTTRAGFEFSFNPQACETCPGNCCRGESGNIWVKAVEIEAIGKYLQIGVFDFIRDYLHKKDNSFILREKVDSGEYFCVFFDRQKQRCGIYPVRPKQCREYPFWDYFKEHPQQLRDECPGIDS